MITSSNINIMCSNDTRNGKTLMSRVFVDYLSLIGRSARVFDTDGTRHGISAYYPATSQVVDISRTQGQIDLFDTILAQPQDDFVIDLSAQHFSTFFEAFSDIGFERGAEEAGLRVTVYFLLEPTPESVLAAAGIRKKIRKGNLVPVCNELIGNAMKVPSAAANYHLIRPDREFKLPALDLQAAKCILDLDFSFEHLFSEETCKIPLEPKMQLCDFLAVLHKQFTSMQLNNDLADLRRQGVL